MKIFQCLAFLPISGRVAVGGYLAGLVCTLPGCAPATGSNNRSDGESKSRGVAVGAVTKAASNGKVNCCETNGATDPPVAACDSLGLVPITIPETPLVDQNGRPVDIGRDLVGDRVAAIQFVFTRCVTTCPILGNQFAEVRRRWGTG